MALRFRTLSKASIASMALALGVSVFAIGAQAHDDCGSRGRHYRHHHHHDRDGATYRRYGKTHAYVSHAVVKGKRHRHVTRTKVKSTEKMGARTEGQAKTKGAGQPQAQPQPKSGAQPKAGTDMKK